MDWTIGITTLEKTHALKALIDSLIEFGYDKKAHLMVADDGCNQPYEISQALNPYHPVWKDNYGVTSRRSGVDGDIVTINSVQDELMNVSPPVALAYNKKTKRKGVSVNKNRCIDYFLKHTSSKYLLLPDDDVMFIKEGFLEEMEEVLSKNRIGHITGIWPNDDRIQLSGNPWFKDFEVESMGYRVTWHRGCQGVMNVYTRECLEAIGYFHLYKARYGFEHDSHSALAEKEFHNRSPEWKPVYTRCGKYYRGQAVPNNYGDTQSDIAVNGPQHDKIFEEIAKGLNRKNKDSGLDNNEILVKECNIHF